MLRQHPHASICTFSSSSSSRQYATPRAALSRPALQAASTTAATSCHPHGGCSPVASSTSTSSSTSWLDSGSSSILRAANVICRDAPRPMWARGPAPSSNGGALTRMITKQISEADSMTNLADVHNEWGGSFDYIHTAAALVQFVRLSRGAGDSKLLQALMSRWLMLMPEAKARACANVIWVCSNLGKEQQQLSTVWQPTWAAFMQHVRTELKEGEGEALQPQSLSNILYAAAKMRKQPGADELQLLVQAFLQPDVLAAAKPQAVANFIWAISKLFQLSGWQGGVSEQDVQQLLSNQQLQLVANSANEQSISNVLVAFAGMSGGGAPLISASFAQECAGRLLAVAPEQLSRWTPQHISNAMWACSELGLVDMQLFSAAVAAAPRWVPRSSSFDLTQAATACAQMQYKNEAFLKLLLQQARYILQQPQGSNAGRMQVRSASDKASLAALCSMSVVSLDMPQLAGTARELVVSSGVGRHDGRGNHPANLRHLWVFHSWLLQQQLLDGKGLTGVLTRQQLQQGERDAAAYGVGIKSIAVL